LPLDSFRARSKFTSSRTLDINTTTLHIALKVLIGPTGNAHVTLMTTSVSGPPPVTLFRLSDPNPSCTICVGGICARLHQVLVSRQVAKGEHVKSMSYFDSTIHDNSLHGPTLSPETDTVDEGRERERSFFRLETLRRGATFRAPMASTIYPCVPPILHLQLRPEIDPPLRAKRTEAFSPLNGVAFLNF
jgi:hypothetical protein